MIYKLRIISDENELFARTIEISENDTFLSLHKAIQDACDYNNAQIASFFVSDDDWDKLQQITPMDMCDEDTKTLPMEKEVLNQHITKVDDKLIYQFDFLGDRALFITLTDIVKPKAKVEYPICSHEIGNAPLQTLHDDDEFAEMFNDLEEGEDFDEFDDLDDEFDEEFDDEGYDDFGGGGSYNYDSDY
ncbi:MAG: plasmid pRiA4b ORF-3 family protein [Bacteroidetes bacterium]|nr:plasmid pRiA4b ORF-3 family protein [Bacteroidota bacterium]